MHSRGDRGRLTNATAGKCRDVLLQDRSRHSNSEAHGVNRGLCTIWGWGRRGLAVVHRGSPSSPPGRLAAAEPWPAARSPLPLTIPASAPANRRATRPRFHCLKARDVTLARLHHRVLGSPRGGTSQYSSDAKRPPGRHSFVRTLRRHESSRAPRALPKSPCRAVQTSASSSRRVSRGSRDHRHSRCARSRQPRWPSRSRAHADAVQHRGSCSRDSRRAAFRSPIGASAPGAAAWQGSQRADLSSLAEDGEGPPRVPRGVRS